MSFLGAKWWLRVVTPLFFTITLDSPQIIIVTTDNGGNLGGGGNRPCRRLAGEWSTVFGPLATVLRGTRDGTRAEQNKTLSKTCLALQ